MDVMLVILLHNCMYNYIVLTTYVKVLVLCLCFKESQKEFTIFRVQANFLRDATIVLLRVAAFRRIFGDAAQLLPPPDSPSPDLHTSSLVYSQKGSFRTTNKLMRLFKRTNVQ